MKKKTIIMVFICLIVIIGIGTSYGYYLANFNVENPENNTNNIQTQTLTQVVMDMQGKIEGKEIYPGHKMVKEVIVKGIGNKELIERILKLDPRHRKLVFDLLICIESDHKIKS